MAHARYEFEVEGGRKTFVVEGLDPDEEVEFTIGMPDGDHSVWLPVEDAEELYEALAVMLGYA